MPTLFGSRWDLRTLKQILTAPRIAGHRAYRGAIVYRNAWVPIIDDDTFRQVVHLLSDPSRPARWPQGGTTTTRSGAP